MQNSEQIYNKLISEMPNSKKRQNQLQMVQLIDKCLSNVTEKPQNGSNLCLIEAPTGTGKSLAYLVSGVSNATLQKKKLVISTATKTLQNQLVDKDIPNFIKYSKVKFKYQLAKGRSNYFCPYQLQLNLNELTSDLLTDKTEINKSLQEIEQLFLSKAWDGDLDAIPIKLDQTIKPLITIDKDSCLGYSCPYNQKDACSCPFYANREKLKSCDVIVTNHSLLLADLMLGGGSVLPSAPADYFLCLDEAHSFADIAINSFTESFALKHSLDSCQSLARFIYNAQSKGYIYSDIPLCDKLFNKVNELSDALDKLLMLLSNNMNLFAGEELIINDYLNQGAKCFKDDFVAIAFVASDVYDNLLVLQEKLKENLKQGADYLVEGNLNKLGYYITLVEKVLTTSNYMVNEDSSRYNANARWISLKQLKGNHEFIVYAGLTHVGNLLFKKLWSKVNAAIITSATLAVGNEFKYYLYKLGLNAYSQVTATKLPTNFAYARQAQIVVPRFNHAPGYASRDDFTKELVNYLSEALAYKEGYGTLVLFFNKVQLQEVYDLLPRAIRKNILLQQDYFNRHKLITDHCVTVDQGKPSIIFGLNSFAEGVDLPALYCIHVIITKLPFETHKDPYNLVQEYWFRFEKSNYFAEVSLPETCIKLIQAAGRLIRDEDDYGQVSICDNRLITKGYGATLLNALPDFNRKYNSEFINQAFKHMESNQGR